MAQIETNLQETVKRFESMQISGRELEKTLHELTKRVIKEARSQLSKAARAALPNDPRQAYKAVKSAVYRRILGGNVSILQKKGGKSVKMMEVAESRRSGNRSQRTTNLLSYYGTDRGFILRFLNSGTSDRVVQTFNNGQIKGDYDTRNPKRKYKGGIGNRGRIGARNFFPGAAHKAMENASEHLAKLIEQEIEKIQQ